MKKFKIYKILNENYYHLLFNKNNVNYEMKKEYRRYIGFVGIELNRMKYAIPLWSDRNNRYEKKYKYELLIEDHSNNKLGILRINKMIPIIDNEHFIKSIDMNSLDYQDGIRLFKELEFLNQPHIYDKVHQLANEIYEKRYNAAQEELANNTDLKFAVDFKQAEILMFKYAFELYDANLLDEAPLIPEHIANESLYKFSQLDQHCLKNNITNENRFCIYESDAYEIELLKHENGDLELVEEIWDGEEDGPDGKILYYRPYINKMNRIAKKWSVDEISQMTKDELIEDIKNNLGWVDEMWDATEEGEEEFKDELSEYFDNWNIFNKTSQQQKSK